MNFPYYDLVPKDLKANCNFRRDLIEQGGSDPTAAREIWCMCSRDALFYINSCAFLLEPRSGRTLPFITYPFQDDAIEAILEAIGHHDLVIEKSRDMGASWMCVTCLEWLWHFHTRDVQTFLMLSRKEELVDKRGDPKSLFSKIDFLHRHMPGWLMPALDRKKMHLINLNSHSSIDGESTNEFAGVADRRRALLLDEFSKMDNQHNIFRGTRDVTRCRIFNYTPQGSANTAYDIAHDVRFEKLSLHWSLHPVKAKGLYRFVNGELELLDKEYWTPERVEEYDFIDEPPKNPKYNFRSPWYDKECMRALNPMEIAQELDMDYLGSDYVFFDAVELDRITEESVLEPRHIGDFVFELGDIEPQGFDERADGSLRLWVTPGSDGKPPANARYVMGVDTSAGEGQSNSAIVVADELTGEQVAEYADPHISPHHFADLVVAMAKWFQDDRGRGAFIVPEATGPGGTLMSRILELRYPNLYYRMNKLNIAGKSKTQPGFSPHASAQRILFDNFKRGLQDGRFRVRSRLIIAECKQILYTTSGIAHGASLRTDDPSGAKANHGDRATAAALCWEGMIAPSVRVDTQEQDQVLDGSLAHRRQLFERARLAESLW